MFPCSCRLSVCDRLPHWFKLPVWWESHVVVVTTAAAAFNSHFKNSHVFLDNVVMIIYLMILGLNNVLNNWPENFTSWFLSLIPVFLLQRKKKHMWLVFSFTQWPFCQKKGYFLFVFFFMSLKFRRLYLMFSFLFFVLEIRVRLYIFDRLAASTFKT